MHHYVGIFVYNIHKDITNGEGNGEFFLALTDKCLFFRFSWLDLATDKLSQKPSGFVRRALAYHKFIFVPDQGCYYFSHCN
jgi:hypothetical protein